MESPYAGYKKLPKPVEANYRWQEQGACRGVDSEKFFLPFNCRNEEKRLLILEAKSICKTCPVIDACREFAITTEQPYGVWGGLSEEELKSVIRRKKRYRNATGKKS